MAAAAREAVQRRPVREDGPRPGRRTVGRAGADHDDRRLASRPAHRPAFPVVRTEAPDPDVLRVPVHAAAREGRDDRARHRTLPVKEKKRPWQKHYDDVIPGHNGFSPSGNVRGEVVYANYGRPEDFALLAKNGVSVKDKIVLVRYGAVFPGSSRARPPSAARRAMLIYSDPADDGYGRGPVYPDGPWRAPDGIQRGSIAQIQLAGDPQTPGWYGEGRAPHPAIAGPHARRPHPDDADLLRRGRAAAARAEGRRGSEGLAGRPAVHLPDRARGTKCTSI